jgi:DNA-binding MarR family transcriptional regulator
MGMTKGAITKLADRLIGKSLMIKTGSKVDGRSHTLRLSKNGESLVPRLADKADQNEAECFSHLSERDRAVLEKFIRESVKRFGLNSIPIN